MAITNKVFKESESWLTKERQKFENFAEEKFQKFSTEYQQEVDWLRDYLQEIVFRTTKVENLKKNELLEIPNQLKDKHEIEPRESLTVPTLITRERSQIMRNNVEIVNTSSGGVTQQLKRFVVKHTPKLKPEKPEIKSLVLAAAAAKREKEEQDKRLVRAKEWEKARQRRQEEQQKRLQSLKNRDDELKKKVNVISDAKRKDTDLMRKKKIDNNKISKDTIQNQTGQNQKELDRTAHTNENTSVIFSKKVQLYDQLKRLGLNKKQIELPEIDSDEDEKVEIKNKRLRKDWEQSPELKAALMHQSSIDPETIFGKILPLNIDEREYRLRPRSSSANWSGLDALTEEEELEYKIHMGFL
ncbi:2571_t:CDS:2 [Funneliformis caledonium]|uniref:2571_t:CDS:1 n=1 Tax=Funneliformis caledonium TaxID=1117310 RepID=A0A9N8YT60_9GLOM|nr:2571_t:CDS:2 [Funneliformis caledonium]